MNVVGTDAGTYIELQGTAEGLPFDRERVDGAARPGGQRAGAPVRGPGDGPRCGPALSRAGAGLARPRSRRRDALGAQAPGAPRAAPARERGSRLPRRARGSRRARRGRPDVRDERPDQGPLRGPRDGLAGPRRRLRHRGRGARRRAGRPDASLRRPGRDRRREQREAPPGARGRARRAARAPATSACWRSRCRDEAAPGGLRIIERRGTCRGRVALEPRGSGGFGYDPLFEPARERPGGRTFGEYSAAAKDAISHRGRAARRMAPLLRELTALRQARSRARRSRWIEGRPPASQRPSMVVRREARSTAR